MNHLQKILTKVAAFWIPDPGDALTIHLPNEFFRSEKCACGGQIIQTYTNENDQPKDPMRIKFGAIYNYWKEPGMSKCSVCKRMYGLDPVSRTLLNDYFNSLANRRVVMMRTDEEIDLSAMYDHDTYLLFFQKLVIPIGTVLIIIESREYVAEEFLIPSKELLELKEYFPRKDAFDEVEGKIVVEKGKFKPGMVKTPRDGAWDKRSGFMTYVPDGIIDSGRVGFFLPGAAIPRSFFQEQNEGFNVNKLADLLEIMNDKNILNSIEKDPGSDFDE